MNEIAPSTPLAQPSLALPAATIALGAFLLFLVQPLLAKRILPWFGGSAAVWTACMLFFQLLPLGRYLDLRPVLVGEGKAGPWKTVEVSNEGDADEGVYSSDWVLMSESEDLFKRPELADATVPLAAPRTVRLWSDDFSNLYKILK